MRQIILALGVLALIGWTSTASAQPTAPRIPHAKGFLTKDQVKFEIGRYGGRLVRDSLGEPKSFNPITAGETSTTDYTDRIFQGLIDEDPWTGEMVGVIADRWEVAEDGVTWTIYLRKDVVFNDGTPLTADDVVFSWNELVYDTTRPAGTDPRWPCSLRDIATFDGKIIKFEKVDEYTVKATTPMKLAIAPRIIGGVPVMPRAKYQRMVSDGSFGGALGSDAKPEDIVGSGPWMLGSYTRGQNVTLKRNPNYWKKDAAGNRLPYLDELVFQITRDLNLFLVNFRQGITDVYGLQGGKDVPELRKIEPQDFTIYQLGPDYGTTFLSLNMNLDAARAGKVPDYKVNWFRDVRFRRALSHAIDRNAMVRNIHRNLGYPQAAPFTRATGPFLVEGIQPLEFNPDKARALLEEMGLKMGRNGVRVDEQGREVSFILHTNSGNNSREEQCNFIRKDLEAIGVKVNFLPLEFNALVDRIDNSHDWEAILMGFTGGREPNDGANFWKSDARLHMWWPEQKVPGFDWERRIDEIFLQGVQELDITRRKALYREWIELVHEQQPVIYLTNIERAAAIRNKFANVNPAPAPDRALLQIEEYLFIRPG